MKRGRFIPLVTAALLLCSAAAYTFANSQKPHTARASRLQEEQFDKFLATKVSLSERGENGVFFSLQADRIIHRKRISRLFVYQNLKEILLSGVTIDVFPANAEDGQGGASVLPVESIGRVLMSLGGSSGRLDNFSNVKADITFDLLTRVLFEDLLIRVHLAGDKGISVFARNASINFDSRNIVFSNDVKFIDPAGRTIDTSDAVWSKKFSGFYVPRGYKLGARLHRRAAFFVPDRRGDLVKSAGCPKIDYSDRLEKEEDKLYSALTKNSPYFNMIAGMPVKQ